MKKENETIEKANNKIYILKLQVNSSLPEEQLSVLKKGGERAIFDVLYAPDKQSVHAVWACIPASFSAINKSILASHLFCYMANRLGLYAEMPAYKAPHLPCIKLLWENILLPPAIEVQHSIAHILWAGAYYHDDQVVAYVLDNMNNFLTEDYKRHAINCAYDGDIEFRQHNNNVFRVFSLLSASIPGHSTENMCAPKDYVASYNNYLSNPETNTAIETIRRLTRDNISYSAINISFPNYLSAFSGYREIFPTLRLSRLRQPLLINSPEALNNKVLSIVSGINEANMSDIRKAIIIKDSTDIGRWEAFVKAAHTPRKTGIGK